ncbi:holo-ACP synthase [Flexivirga alba]|jgi:phosphopantethiene--protein transferase domain|uniref:Holo-[acyl-carrier-protein] synthase n=1 Tax=Flexivirga alba TaxID=702742 RepID=A0ABW2AGF9_9MICO
MTKTADIFPTPSRHNLSLADSPFVLRVGIDVQTVSAVADSIQRHGRRYLDRVFSPQEVETCGGYDAEPHELAPGLTARFCAKEAVLKALRPLNIIPEWRDIELVRMPGGWVGVNLVRGAKTLAEENHLLNFEISMSHDNDIAMATAVAIGFRQPEDES